MKASIRNIVWRFQDCATIYPELARKIYIRNPSEVFTNFRFLFTDQVRERFVVFWLNSANRVCGFEVISEGILNSSLVHPREVFRGAIVATAASIILAHNHPSSNPEPSAEDIAVTKQLVETGKIVDIPVHDHLIFTDDAYTSFAERCLL